MAGGSGTFVRLSGFLLFDLEPGSLIRWLSQRPLQTEALSPPKLWSI
jgi:hypothetical protein